jgi:hypothetical protein
MEPIEKPFSKDVPAGVTIKSVFNLVAIGGEKAVKAVKQYGRVNSNTSSAIAFNFTKKADAQR